MARLPESLATDRPDPADQILSMNLVWLIAPGGVSIVGLLLYAAVPFYHESLAEWQLQRGRDRRAARHLEAALRILANRQGSSSLVAAAVLAGLARVRILQGNPDLGRPLLATATQTVLGHSVGKPSRRLIRTLVRVGQAANVAEAYMDAALLGEKAESLALGLFNRADSIHGTIAALLADAYAGQGLFEQAHQHYQGALEVFRLASGEDCPQAGAVFVSMSAALAREERWREAREAGLEAVDILDQTDATQLPEALSVLADLDARRGRLAEAEGLRVSICHLWERLGGTESAALAREYERRAELLRSMERVTEAGYLTGKAQKIRRAVAIA